MSDNCIDECSGISTRKTQTDFFNISMNYIVSFFLELVRVNRQSIEIPVSETYPGNFGIFRIVKISVSVHAVFVLFKNCMAEYILYGIMIVTPHKWNLASILF